jgi:hypothetical protein
MPISSLKFLAVIGIDNRQSPDASLWVASDIYTPILMDHFYRHLAMGELRVPSCVFTLTLPLVAPFGTVVLISELDTTVNLAEAPLNVTLVAHVRLFPRITTGVPTSPEVGSVSTNGPSPTARLKTVPQPPKQLLPVTPSEVVP